MRRAALRAWVLCWLVLVWILLWGTFSAANILSGLAVALVITMLLPLPAVPVEGRVHPLSLLRLILRVAYYLVQSSVQVAGLAVRPGPPPLNAVLRAHLAIKSDLVLALAVNVINLIPGTIVLEIDQARRLIYVHVLDVGSDRAEARFHHQISEVERLVVASFERDEDWRPVAREEADSA
jgi:multicomponent Na+:H+ antiporter subunit E